MPYSLAAFAPRRRPWYSRLLQAGSSPGHIATGRIKSMKNHNHIWNRTRGLPTCSAVPQLTAPPRNLAVPLFTNLGTRRFWVAISIQCIAYGKICVAVVFITNVSYITTHRKISNKVFIFGEYMWLNV